MDDAGCLECHGGNDPLAPNIRASLNQTSGHFVDRYRGEHRADESPEEAATHVSCLDCHNPHRSTSRPAAGPMDIGGALEGVPGVTYTDIELDEAQFEYEVCLRCHGGQRAQAQGFPVRRQLEQFDLEREIDPSNASYHPVVAPGRNPNVPSLLTQWSEGSVMRCTDCHSNEKESPAGPHGSPHEWILAGEHQTGDGITESPRAYQLCYQCHSRASILADESFPEHRLHVVDDRASCAVCHDPHGVSHTQGDPINHSHLINFDISVVEPDPTTGRLEFVDMGAEAGACYLTCHGRVHGPEVY
jgi:nitrate reductase cytochrome c-type subunit